MRDTWKCSDSNQMEQSEVVNVPFVDEQSFQMTKTADDFPSFMLRRDLAFRLVAILVQVIQ